MIRFENVSKVYDETSSPALDGVDLEIDRGDFVYLVGSSGSGKSTFLQLVLREQKATRGRVLVAGKDVALLSSWKVPHLRRQMGAVFQDFRLLPNKTVFENVAFALEVLGRSRSQINSTVPQTLEMVGLDGKARRLPHELSGGEQQRVAIARAFVNRPAILLADEPTGNLDPTTSRGIMNVLGRINETGTTIVMATHDVALVDEIRRRVIELEHGKLIRDEAEGAYTTTSIPVIRLDDDLPPAPSSSTAISPLGTPVVPLEQREQAPAVEDRVVAGEPVVAEPVVAEADPAVSHRAETDLAGPVLADDVEAPPMTRRELRERRARELQQEIEQSGPVSPAEPARAPERDVAVTHAAPEHVAPEPVAPEPAARESAVEPVAADLSVEPEPVHDVTDPSGEPEQPRRRGLFRRR